MSSHLSELCTLLVEEFAGSLPAAVFSALVARDNLSLRQLVQASKLVPRFAENALSVLLVRQLVVYSAARDDESASYEVCLENAYNLLRVGKHLELVKAYLGDQASYIVDKLQQRGLVTANEILTFPQGPLEKLSNLKYIVVARRYDLRSAHTNDQIVADEAERELGFRSRGLLTAADKKLLQSLIDSKRKRERDDNFASFEILQARASKGYTDTASETQPLLVNGTGQAERQNRELTELNGNVAAAEDGNNSEDPEIEQQPKQARKRKIQNLRSEKKAEVITQPQNTDKSHNTRRTRNSATSTEQALATSKPQTAKSNGPTKRSAPEPGEKENSNVTDKMPQRSKRRKIDHEPTSEAEEGASSNHVVKRGKDKATANTRASKQRTRKSKADNLELVDEHDHNRSQMESFGGSDAPVQSERPRPGANQDSAENNKPSTSLEMTDPGGQSNEAIFRLNLEKFNVSHRSQLLSELCQNTLGQPTSQVYAALLRCLERNIRRCDNDEEADEQGGDESSDSDSDEDEDKDENEDEEGNRKRRLKRKTDRRSGVPVTQINSELDHKADIVMHETSKTEQRLPMRDLGREAQVEYHLQILKADEKAFAHAITINGQRRWCVDFTGLSSLMIQTELENIVAARFDESSARVVRVLYEQGKMEEKHLATKALVIQKDIRAKCALMQQAGFLDLQEVPRDATRQPNRTFYLWFFDQDRCRRVLLDDTYQIMSRLLQRLRRERLKFKSVLEKASRTDVAGREDELLNDAEKTALRQLEREEDQIWVQLSRLDDQVAILRDFK